MKRRHLLSLTSSLAATFLIAAYAQPAWAQGKKRHQLLIQVSDNDPAKWSLALNNARNLQDDVGAANVDIELVVYGPGMHMLKNSSPVAARISQAVEEGLVVVACENSVRGQQLSHADLLPTVRYVPAAVTEIMKKQSEGWSYLRP